MPYLNRKDYPLSSFRSKIEENIKQHNLAVELAKVLFSRLKEFGQMSQSSSIRIISAMMCLIRFSIGLRMNSSMILLL